jgi:hypothetical protein
MRIDRRARRQGAMKTSRLCGALAWAVLGLTVVALLGHRWLALGWNAWHYATARPSARTQIAVGDGRAYLAAGVDGVEIVDLSTGRRAALLPPPAPADRIDDVAVADGWLFALDATPPGHLAIYRAADLGRPTPTSEVVTVPVGPFSGVAAAAGVVAVSGGTSQLTLREYDDEGRLSAEVATADYGRGQPDVTLSADGRLAAISTHLYGPEFAITFAEVRRRPLGLRALGRLALHDAGFTRGGYKPAHFPLVTAWSGDRIYVADGGGLEVIDLADATHPRLLLHDRRAQPAMDLLVAGDELDVVRAGSQPAVVRYRLGQSGLPSPVGIWSAAAGERVAAIARSGADLVVTRHEGGWQRVPPSGFSPLGHLARKAGRSLAAVIASEAKRSRRCGVEIASSLRSSQ